MGRPPPPPSEAPRQLDVEGVEVDIADALEELGGPGVGQGLGQLLAPGLVLGLQLAELVDGVGPPLRPRPAVLRAGRRCRRRRGARRRALAREAPIRADFEAKVRGDNESVSAKRTGFIG